MRRPAAATDLSAECLHCFENCEAAIECAHNFQAWPHQRIVRSMPAMVKATLGKCVLVCAATFTLLSCSNNQDTVVAVNFAFDDSTADVKSNVATFHIKVEVAERTAEADLAISRNDKGEITTAAWKRVVVNGMSGTAKVTLTAKDASGATLLEVSADAVLVEHSAIEVLLKLTRNPPQPPAGSAGGSTGAGGASAGGTGAAGTGAGGTGAGGASAGGTGAGGTGAGGSGAGGTGAGSSKPASNGTGGTT